MIGSGSRHGGIRPSSQMYEYSLPFRFIQSETRIKQSYKAGSGGVERSKRVKEVNKSLEDSAMLGIRWCVDTTTSQLRVSSV